MRRWATCARRWPPASSPSAGSKNCSRATARETIRAAIDRIFDETEAQVPDARRARSPTATTKRKASSTTTASCATNASRSHARGRRSSGSDMTIDLTEVVARSGAARSTRARWPAPYIAYKGLTGPLEPVNEGSFRALKVEIQEGNMMMARFPAPMAGWSRGCRRVVDTILQALAQALPDAIPAAHLGHARRLVRVLRPRCRQGPQLRAADDRGRRLGRPAVGRRRVGRGLGVPGRRAQRADRDDRAQDAGAGRAARAARKTPAAPASFAAGSA